MVKLVAPQMALDASGSFGNAITYSKWNGLNYSRLKVTPSNPKTEGQMTNRAYFSAGGKITKKADYTGDVVTFTKTKTPAGQSWASYFVSEMMGAQNANIIAAKTAYNLVGNATVKGYFDDAAAQAGIEGVNIGSEAYEQLPAGLLLWAAYAASYRLGDPLADTIVTSAAEAGVFAYTEGLTGILPT